MMPIADFSCSAMVRLIAPPVARPLHAINKERATSLSQPRLSLTLSLKEENEFSSREQHDERDD